MNTWLFVFITYLPLMLHFEINKTGRRYDELKRLEAKYNHILKINDDEEISLPGQDKLYSEMLNSLVANVISDRMVETRKRIVINLPDASTINAKNAKNTNFVNDKKNKGNKIGMDLSNLSKYNKNVIQLAEKGFLSLDLN